MNHLRKAFKITLLLFSLIAVSEVYSQELDEQNFKNYDFALENPITSQWITIHLKKGDNRLMLSNARLARLKDAIAHDECTGKQYKIIKRDADYLCGGAPLMNGNLSLSMARDGVLRNSVLGITALTEPNPSRYIKRLNEELLFLASRDYDYKAIDGDQLRISEAALALSIGLSWCESQLPRETVKKVKSVLINKILKPSLETDKYNLWWIDSSNNWNAVCHGGLSAAAIVTADADPVLASKILTRTLQKLPLMLSTYFPDGVFPEGTMYWNYATTYTIYMIEMFRAAFHTDFNITKSPGFMKSSESALLSIAPSDNTFNYADCGDKCTDDVMPVFSWFDVENRYGKYFNREEYIKMQNAGLAVSRPQLTGTREVATSLLWLCENKFSNSHTYLPEKWIGKGLNPVAYFRSQNSNRGFFFGFKGGKAHLAHGNMDAGSFVYELDGERWAVDPGIQGYTALEKVMGSELWSFKQDARRWELLSKNNFGHSTLTVNNQMFDVDGFSDLYETGTDEFTADLTAQYFKNVDSARRTVKRINETNVRITDNIQPNNKTKDVVWAMLTQADVKVDSNMVHLSQNGKQCDIAVITPSFANIRVVSLDPPPLSYDIMKKGLKRIEIVQSNRFNAPMQFEVEMGVNILTPKQIKSNMYDWADYAHYEKSNREITKAPKAVFMGNSITEGWAKRDPNFFASNNYVGRGISGQTSIQMLARFRADVIDLHPRYVVILAGTNDIARNTGYISLDNVFRNIASMCDIARKNHIKPILCSVTPTYYYSWIWPDIKPADEVIKLNKMLKTYADREKITYVDYFSKMKDDRNGMQPSLTKDGLHPTLDGYKIMEELIQKVLK